MIRPYLRDILNDHKTQGKQKVYSGNEVIDYKTQGKWKIQLTITMLSVPITPALNYEQIKSHPERISKIKPFNEHNDWNEIDFPSHKKNWKKFEKGNKSIAVNILYVPHNTK